MPKPCTNCYGKVALALCLQVPRSKNILRHIKYGITELNNTTIVYFLALLCLTFIVLAYIYYTDTSI
jgi:hypothetical protein